MHDGAVVGWDIGGAHVKASLLRGGEVLDAAQWPCPLWQGLDQLQQALATAQQRWPALRAGRARGDDDRRDGRPVRPPRGRRAAHRRRAGADACASTAALLRRRCRLVRPRPGGAQWRAYRVGQLAGDRAPRGDAVAEREALLVDIGSTTTDLIALRRGACADPSRSDAERLASGELVYQGVVRTPLCALAQRIAWRGRELNVMNEFFATTADVYRLTGELDPAHDQRPSADNAAKDAAGHTPAPGPHDRPGRARRHAGRVAGLRARLARRAAGGAARPDARASGDCTAWPRRRTLVSAGCGDFLVPELGDELSCAMRAMSRAWRRAAPHAARWAQVCAPGVAVAALFVQASRPACGSSSSAAA